MIITIRVLNHEGDKTFQYDSELQLEQAALHIRDRQDAGYSVFCVDSETKETSLVKEFFPAQQFIVVPQIAGG